LRLRSGTSASRDVSEDVVDLLAHALLFPANGLRVAGGSFQVRVTKPQLDCPDVDPRKQSRASKGVAELVKLELRAEACLRLCLHRTGRICQPGWCLLSGLRDAAGGHGLHQQADNHRRVEILARPRYLDVGEGFTAGARLTNVVYTED
jgi:hypothetical protein